MRRRSLHAALLGAVVLLAGFAAWAQAPELVAVPEGKAALHYFRPDGKYAGWGLHVWTSFDKVQDGKVVGPKDKSDKPLPGVSWAQPMPPTGTDGYGAYWLLNLSDFGNGKINYIIHQGDSKEQCGKDIAWFVETQGKEVFVNRGDCNTYSKAEDAIAARK
jgi:hypothetical protein